MAPGIKRRMTSEGSSMSLIARFAIRRPVPVLIFWVGAFVLSLFFLG